MALYEGSTLNTPSLMAVEDYLAALKWGSRIGGLPELIRRSKTNFETLDAWVRQSDWIDYLCEDEGARSHERGWQDAQRPDEHDARRRHRRRHELAGSGGGS